MKQVLRKGLKDIVVETVPEPRLRSNGVLIRPFYSLISAGTETADLHTDPLIKEVADNPSHIRKVLDVMKVAGPVSTLTEVKAKFSELASLGYSGAGVVVDKHESVNDLEIGDRVAYGGEGTGHGEVILTGRKLVARVPDVVPFEHACFTTLGSIAMNGVRAAQITLGETVVVMGLGLVGQLTAQLARLHGARVIAVDLKADRVTLAKQLGADDAVIGGDSTVEEVRSLTNGLGADCVIIAAASKSAVPAQQAVRLCRDRGRVVIVGVVKMDLPRDEMYVKEIQVLMSRAYGPGSYDPNYEVKGNDYPLPYVRWTENRNMEEFLRLIANGGVLLQSLITHQFALEEAAQAYQTIMSPESNSLAVLLRYPASTSASKVVDFEPQRKVMVTQLPAKRDELGVAVVGAGNLARWEHLPNLKKSPGVRMQAICSASGPRGKSYAQRFGASYCTSDYTDVLKDPEVDVVVLVTRHEHHAAEALAALRAGKHVFVEKPMALTDEECREIYHAVAETGKQITVGFNRRFAPYYLEMKQKVGRRTSPIVVDIRVNSPGMTGNFWAADPKLGGAIIGEATHFIDLMYWLIGAEPVQVSAYSLPTGKTDPIGENNIAASLLFADGSIGNLIYCTVGSKTSQGERVEVFSPGLSVVVENFKRLQINGQTSVTRTKWWAEKGYAAQMESFLADVRKGNAPAIAARDGARATMVGLRLMESARNLKPCLIDLDRLLS